MAGGYNGKLLEGRDLQGWGRWLSGDRQKTGEDFSTGRRLSRDKGYRDGLIGGSMYF